MKYRFTTSILSLAFFTFLFSSSVLKAAVFITPKAPAINVDSYVLIDFDSQKVIASKNPDKAHAPASLTKVMTAYVVFQLLKDGRVSLNDDVLISEKAWKTMGSKSFVEVGKTIKLETLLQGLIIQSGNDAAVALAEHIAGTEGTFTAYMNEYARELGMNNTIFENASGLDTKNQQTSARDMSILASSVIRDFPEYYKWYSQKTFTYNDIKQNNRNKLLWSDKTVDGLKTGFTDKAKYNLVASAKRLNDMRLISVVLGSSSPDARANETQQLLDYGFRFFETIKIDNIVKSVPLLKGEKDFLKVGTTESSTITLPRGQFKLSRQSIELNKNLSAPIKKGDRVGDLVIDHEGDKIATFPLIALEDIAQSGFFSRSIDSLKSFF